MASVRVKKLSPKVLFRGEQPSLWSPYRDGISQSMVAKFLQCREQTRLHFVEGWTSRRESMPIQFGTCVHWVLSEAYGKKQKTSPSMTWVKKKLVEYTEVWKRELQRMATTQENEEHVETLNMAEIVLSAYFQRWDGDFIGAYRVGNTTVRPHEWIGLEQKFNLPYVYNGREVFLRGMRDGVFRTVNNKTWLLETKTKGVIDEAGIEDTLFFDFQVLLYLLTLYRANPKDVPRGVVYNVIRRPGLRLGKTESWTDFLARVSKDVNDPKRSDHYFIRFQLEISKKELLDWEENTLKPTIEDICKWFDGESPHYMNSSALLAKYGRCDMFEPIVRNNFSGHFQRGSAFNELDEFKG